MLCNAGVSKVLLKPINDHELLKTIKQLTQQSINVTESILQHSNKTNLIEYNIAHHELNIELQTLIIKLKQGYASQNITVIEDINHQIAGVSGLYELPEIECCVAEIHELIQGKIIDWHMLWKVIWRLYRLLKNQN